MKKGLLLWLFVAMSVLQTFAQTRTITGKVTDTKDGSPLPGVSVIVKGTSHGTVTSADGSYKIEAGSNDALIFSFIGYVNQEKPVGGNANISVGLGTDNKQLNEVVVTALGISKEKKALGYSVQKIGADELTHSNENNVIQALASKAAGVQIIGSGGTPGASSKIIIRGNSTFSGNNQPLIVIDGVPIDNSTNSTVARNYAYNANLSGVNNSNRALDINPDDIASVTVLKGPAAAALYGATAASGAIIYTTKRGRSGATKVNYSFNAGFDKVNKMPDEQFEYAQGNWNSAGTPVYQNGTTPYSWGPKISSIDGAKVYHNTDDFFQTGTNFVHDVSVTGGNENTSFRMSLNRVDQKGIIPTTDLQRTSVRINADSKISERLTMGVSAAYVLTEGTKAQNGSNLSGPMLSLMRSPVSWNLADYQYADDGSSKNYFSSYDNPYWSLYNNPFKDKTDRFYGNINTTFKFNNWLSLNNRTGVDMYTQWSKQIFAIGSVSVDDMQGQIEENTFTSRNLYSDLILTGHKTFDQLDVVANVGGNVYQIQGQNNYSKGNQLSIPGYYNLNNASTLYTDNTASTRRTSALFYDLEFAYKNQLFLTTTGRNEWSSSFGAAKNNFFFPSVSASWIFSEVLPANDVLTYAKLRGAIATGGKSPETYAANTVYASPTFADGFTDGNYFPFLGVTGFGVSSSLGNVNLKPERSVEKEVGLDVKLFSRVNLELTYYDKQTKDILVNRPIAGSSGFQYKLENAGKMRNRGVEVLASADVIKSPSGFTWNLSVNWAMNKNKVLELASTSTEINLESAFSSIGSYAIIGQPYGALYGTKWERAEDGQLLIGADGLPTSAAAAGNLGNPFPDWTGGARNTFTYKNFTLSALLDVRHGGKIWNGTYARLNNLGRTAESADRERTYVIPGVVLGTDGKYTANTTAVDAQSYFRYYKGDVSGAAVENSVEDGSWVRLREVSLGYKYNFSQASPIKSVELTLTGRNLWLHTKYHGVDPETSLTGAGSNLTGFDYFNNPGTKTYAVGVRVGF